MTEILEAKRRLQHLLLQLQLTDDQYMPFFESASLSRMTVHKKERVWKFMIQVEQVLPFELFLLLQTRLREKFAGIADVKLILACENKEVSHDLICSYWPVILEEIDDMSPPLRNRLIGQQPAFNGQTVLFTCALEIEHRTLKAKYAEKISAVYTSYGFPLMPVDFKMVEEAAEQAEAHQAFLEQRRIEEEELG